MADKAEERARSPESKRRPSETKAPANEDSARSASFERHYEQWSDPVFRYLIHLTGSPATAEDLFQETWMKALEHQRQLKDPARFGPWVMRIARNLAFNQMRRRGAKTQVWILSNMRTPAGLDPDNAGEDFIDRQPSPESGPRDIAIRSQRRQIVQEAIAELDPASQEMLQLRYFEHLGLAEIAEVLEVPLGTVCTKVHRGLKAVREHMKRQGYTDLHDI